MSVVVVLVLVAWFLCSVIVQMPSRLADWLSEHDPVGLLPRWTFFAPRPGTVDHHLLYRSLDGADPITEWIEIPLLTELTVTEAFWNPTKRLSKFVTDTASMISLKAGDERALNGLMVSVPYLAILNFVEHEARGHSGSAVQFMIVGTKGHDSDGPPELVLRSRPHPVKAA